MRGDSIKAIVQNKVTQMYLCSKGYWNKDLKYVTYLDKHTLRRETANLNASVIIVRS